MKKILFLLLVLGFLQSCTNTKTASKNSNKTEKVIEPSESDGLVFENEKHFKNMKQLTFGGDNAETYWSYDDSKVVMQIKNPKWGVDCDQIYIMDPNVGLIDSTKRPQMVSTGKGRTTCSFFMPGDSTVIYSSTHEGGDACPPEPKPRKDHKYVWPIYESFDIYVADLEGNIKVKLTDTPGYDAEPTLSYQGDKIVFTSMRSGDLELYTMDIDGSNVHQVTNELGYDGGAFFSPDGKQLVFRSSRPKTDAEIKQYKDLLKEGLVQPTNMELYICDVDGSNLRQITNLGNANWSPYFHPSGKKILFSSNYSSKRGFPFNIYMIDIDGNNLERITYGNTFASFPMFSRDGKRLIFSSNRNNGGTKETNVFITEWVD